MSSDQRNLLSDLVCFLLLTPLAAASAYLCFLGSRHYFHTSRGEAIGLIFLASFLLLIYLLWLGICIRLYSMFIIKKKLNSLCLNLVVEGCGK